MRRYKGPIVDFGIVRRYTRVVPKWNYGRSRGGREAIDAKLRVRLTSRTFAHVGNIAICLKAFVFGDHIRTFCC